MKPIILLFILATTMQSATIFDFNKTSNVSIWKIVDDVVMGGRSSGKFHLDKEGNGIFKGRISLESNSGFSSLRYRFNQTSTKQYSKIILKVKGDGETYQFRVKSKSSDYYSYIAYFNTTKDWETIELSLSDMYPAFRGRKLNKSNYDDESIEEIAFLIGNKKAEAFKLEIDSIVLK
ncbi:CIA30 family protein [uncultured Maribacter sp.]|uniref:CIA30 family protein n=1 Tax=uncultured Maribacter sp. TaxID=431308 RepID=UPI0030DB555B|tara:strand:- start:2302 stop:2832 length:531 start_codon:yes stop_codon:yes gene_type:complete